MPGVIDKKAISNINKCKSEIQNNSKYRNKHEISYQEVKEWVKYYLCELDHVN